MIREFDEGVTYKQFAVMAMRMNWTAAELATEFRGAAEKEHAISYFARVLAGDPDWGVVIPFNSVITKYVKALGNLVSAGKARACACGCGQPVLGKRRFAGVYCKSRPLGLPN